jgi:hypothetical protein
LLLDHLEQTRTDRTAADKSHSNQAHRLYTYPFVAASLRGGGFAAEALGVAQDLCEPILIREEGVVSIYGVELPEGGASTGGLKLAV